MSTSKRTHKPTRYIVYPLVLIALVALGAVSVRAARAYTPYETATPHEEPRSVVDWVGDLLSFADTTVYACAVPCDGTEAKPNPDPRRCGDTCSCTPYLCEETGGRNKKCEGATVQFPCDRPGPSCPACTNARNVSCDSTGWV